LQARLVLIAAWRFICLLRGAGFTATRAAAGCSSCGGHGEGNSNACLSAVLNPRSSKVSCVKLSAGCEAPRPATVSFEGMSPIQRHGVPTGQKMSTGPAEGAELCAPVAYARCTCRRERVCSNRSAPAAATQLAPAAVITPSQVGPPHSVSPSSHSAVRQRAGRG
jgi:hypothetical protein